MKPILEIRTVGKKYRISHQVAPYLSLREWLGGLFRPSTLREDFWALNEVSFDVQPGECMGIIGRNGAGKSTLLKVLSKITPPTSGRILARGRIASLLEVGTGFHPELTGRENIFLNGSILGMRKNEILSKFDQIIDFAGTEKFLDTPLKHYSNGMQLRLAFSVAAFLEPEILIIDEVLAVGDSEFQKKCLGKMEEVSNSGRTILFVSHNMTAITNLCKRVAILQEGRVKALGSAPDMTEVYRRMVEQDAGESDGLIVNSRSEWKVVQQIELLCDGKRSATAGMGTCLEIRVYFNTSTPLDSPVLGVIIKDNLNTPIIGVNNRNYGKNLVSTPVEKGYLAMRVPELILFEGTYVIDIHFGNGFSDIDVIRDRIHLTVEASNQKELANLPSQRINRIFIKDIDWEYSREFRA